MRILIALALIAALVGCATSGKKITQAQLDQVVSGKTTRSDLIGLFGPPTTEVFNSDGTQVLALVYAHVGFMGIGTEAQGLSMIIGPDGTVNGYSRTGSPPMHGVSPVVAAGPSAQQPAPAQPLSEQAYKDEQVSSSCSRTSRMTSTRSGIGKSWASNNTERS